MADQIADDGTDAADAGSGKINIARLLVRALWQVEWAAANPDAKAPARKEAWKLAAPGKAEEIRTARKALRLLEKRGMVMTLTSDVDEDADDE